MGFFVLVHEHTLTIMYSYALVATVTDYDSWRENEEPATCRLRLRQGCPRVVALGGGSQAQ